MIKKLLKIIVPTGIILYLLFQIIADWTLIETSLQNANIFYVLVAIPFFLLIYPEGAFCWHLILTRMGISTTFIKSFKVWIISNTGRYIPGIIWQYLGRVELAKLEANIPRSQTAASLMLEAFLILLSGIFLGSWTIFFMDTQKINIEGWYFLLLLPLVFLHPNLVNKILKFFDKVTKGSIKRFDIKLSFQETFLLFPAFIINFLINGVALFLLTSSLTGSINYSQIFYFVSIYSLSWVTGYLSVFAPGGLGVTEVTLAYLLSFNMPLPIASAIALIYRFLLTVAELMIFALVLRIKK